MATSGSVNHSITRNLIIRDALLDCNGIEENETPTPTAISDASRRLNNFVKFINERKPLWGKVDYTIPLYDNKQSYTIGPGGNKNVNRPTALDKQARRVTTGSTIETPIEIVARTEYMGLPLKSSAGEVNTFYYDPQLTQGTVYVWPVSSTASISLSDGSTDNWTLAGATYNGKNFTVAEDTIPTGGFMSQDGASMYVVGTSNDVIYQYTLSTANDVSTAVYSTKSYDPTAEETNPAVIYFSTDGLKMYISGSTSKTVFQYTLSTAWDVSTASYDTKSFDPSAEAVGIGGMFFSPDGLNLFINGLTSQSINQYILTTPWDVSTAAYSTLNKSVANFEANTRQIFFSQDGYDVFIIGSDTLKVYQLTLSTPWNISTANYLGKFIDISSEVTSQGGMFSSYDGLNIYVTDVIPDTVTQYELSTAWELLSDTEYYYTGASLTTDPTYVFISNSGTMVEMAEGTLGNLSQYEYALDTDGTLFIYSATDPDLTSGSVKVLTDANPPKLIVTSNRPLEDFDDAGDEPDFPQEAYEMLVANLAYLISRQYCDQARRMELKAQATQLTQEYLANDTEEANMKIQPRRRY